MNDDSEWLRMLTKTDGLMRMSLRIGWHVFPNCQPAVHPRYFDLF